MVLGLFPGDSVRSGVYVVKAYPVFLLASFCLLLSFQNCSQVAFESVSTVVPSKDNEVDPLGNPGGGDVDIAVTPQLIDGKPSTDNLKTNQDTAVSGQASSIAAEAKEASTFTLLSSPTSGSLTAIDLATGAFTYEPKPFFFGRDEFELTEANPRMKAPVKRKVVIDVTRTGMPWIISDLFNFYVNVKDAPFEIEVGDNEAKDPVAALSADGSVTQVATAHGTVKKTPTGFAYTPAADFRGTDRVKMYVYDSKGGLGSKEIRLVVGNPLQSIQPGMAVRASQCIQCHAQISSNFVTDFGFGNKYFMAKDKANPAGGDYVYGFRMNANQTANRYQPEWITTSAFANGAKLIVPKANMGFKYADYAPTWVDKTAEWLQATTVEGLMNGIQKIAGGSFKAEVVAKDSIYIGALSVADIKAAGRLDAANKLQYRKDSDASYELSGLSLAAGGYYTNTETLACDGDLFIDGTLFLNEPKIKTIKGCRIYTTGPIFTQKAVTYVTDPMLSTDPNLQLASARAISQGVGLTHCETTANPGWYSSNNRANPIAMRFVDMATSKAITLRNTDSTSGFPLTAATTAAEGQAIMAEAQKIVGLEDASCHGRNVSFQRMMLVAPQIHSRYKGNFSGVIIGEFPLFSLQSFVYQFDPVFLKVPVLPLVDTDKFLKIQ